MSLYLRTNLAKGGPDKKAKSDKPAKVSGGKGEQRGGQYVARVQVGYRSDGSPKYRYFSSEEEYQKYLSERGKSKQAKDLEHKVKQEHEESTDKHRGLNVHQPASRKLTLLEAEKKSMTKSLYLYVKV